jgi:hypothetical protein
VLEEGQLHVEHQQVEALGWLGAELALGRERRDLVEQFAASFVAYLAPRVVGLEASPKKQAGRPDKWHRTKLEADIALRHGLCAGHAPLVEDLGDLIR